MHGSYMFEFCLYLYLLCQIWQDTRKQFLARKTLPNSFCTKNGLMPSSTHHPSSWVLHVWTDKANYCAIQPNYTIEENCTIFIIVTVFCRKQDLASMHHLFTNQCPSAVAVKLTNNNNSSDLNLQQYQNYMPDHERSHCHIQLCSKWAPGDKERATSMGMGKHIMLTIENQHNHDCQLHVVLLVQKANAPPSTDRPTAQDISLQWRALNIKTCLQMFT